MPGTSIPLVENQKRGEVLSCTTSRILGFVEYYYCNVGIAVAVVHCVNDAQTRLGWLAVHHKLSCYRAGAGAGVGAGYGYYLNCTSSSPLAQQPTEDEEYSSHNDQMHQRERLKAPTSTNQTMKRFDHICTHHATLLGVCRSPTRGCCCCPALALPQSCI